MIKKVLKPFPKAYQQAKAARLKACRVMSHVRYAAYPLRPRQRTKLDGRVIITLTSYPPRFATLNLTLKNLLTQDVADYKVVLWLYKNDYDALPVAVKRLEKNPLFSIRLCEENTKSYKKLIPALQEYKDYFLVTADDDAYYPASWLRSLIEGYDDSVKAVVGRRGHIISLDQDGRIMPYSQWQRNINTTTLDKKVFLTGLGGILYPPHCFDGEVLNQANYMSICGSADDIWFFYMLHRNGYICKKIGGAFPDILWENSQQTALFQENVHNLGNDKVFAAMQKIYGNPLAGKPHSPESNEAINAKANAAEVVTDYSSQ